MTPTQPAPTTADRPGPPPATAPATPAAAGELADAVVAAVLAVPGVNGLHTGVFGEVATYLPGRRVTGIRLDADVVEVHVVLARGVDLLETAGAVRAAVLPLVDRPVDVHIEDLGPDALAADEPRQSLEAPAGWPGDIAVTGVDPAPAADPGGPT